MEQSCARKTLFKNQDSWGLGHFGLGTKQNVHTYIQLRQKERELIYIYENGNGGEVETKVTFPLF